MNKIKQGIKLFLAFTITLSCLLNNALVVKAAGNRVNFALNKPAIGSHQDSPSHSPDKVFDGDLSTRWGTEPFATDQWVRVDLEKNYDFDEFYIAAEDNVNQKIRQFKIEGSNNDNEYELIYQSEDNSNGFDLEYTVNLENPANYRYVRITVQKLIPNAYPSISLREFAIIGNEEERISSVKEALNKLNISPKIYRNFKIPLEDKGLGVSYSWSSDNEALLIDGDNIKVNIASEIENVTLVARASKDGYSQERIFKVQVVSLRTSDYNIYPVPQEMKYGNESLEIKENINVVINNELDSNLINFLSNTLAQYQLKVVISDKQDDQGTNLYLGIDNQDSLAKDYFKNIDCQSIAGINEGYALNVNANKNIIAILGNDYTGLFNGIFTLKEMLASSSKAFKDITILDAPDTKFRGIVEGFYGSYSHKERIDLLKFMGPLKMNTYIYGAKSDSYHTNKWREAYPEKQINELEQLVSCGKENNVEVVWAAHVGGNINMNNDQDFEALVKKFDQLYSIGVRQFGLFYDDAATDNTHLVDFVNKVNREYIHQRAGVKDLIICPEQYCKTRASGDYLDRLANFDQDVQIMWTGDGVISDITPEMMAYIESRIKRPAYIWWNYPVNDLGMGDQLLVGQTVGLSTQMKKMNGLVSNPMLQAQASKFSLFSIADYSWNIVDFDQYKSWDNGVDYIIPEQEYAQAFKIFSANNNQSVAELRDQAVESEYLLAAFQAFKQDLYLGFDLSDAGNNLLAEFKKIESACELLKGYSNNQDLINQISPWLNQLIEVSKAGQIVLENLLYLNEHSIDEAAVIETVHQKYLACQEQLGKTGGKYSGRRELLPFIYEMQNYLSANILRQINNVDHIVPITNYRNGSYLMMDLTKMIDGNQNSFVTFEENEEKGKWIGLELGSVTKMKTIEIFIGKDASDQDIAKKFKVQVSNDGYVWQDIEVVIENNEIRNVNEEKARFIRYLVEEGCNKKTRIREFSINRNDKVVDTNVKKYQAIVIKEDQNIVSIDHIDNFILTPGQYIGVKFARAKQYGDALVNDELKGLTLQYSIDGLNWNTYQDGSFTARYVRLINNQDIAFSGNFDYLKIVGAKMEIPEEITVSMSEGMATWSGSVNDLVDGDRDTYHWTREQRIDNSYILDLKKEMPIKDINVVMISGDMMHAGVVEISNDKENWIEVGKINHTADNIIELENKTGRYIRIRMTTNSNDWLKINEVEINQLVSDTEVPIIEDKRALQVFDQDIKTKYSSLTQAGQIIYNNINDSQATKFNVLKNSQSLIKIEGLFDDKWIELVSSQGAFISCDFTGMGIASKFKISWQDNANVQIYEMGVTNSEFTEEINKEILLQTIEKAQFLKANGYLDDASLKAIEYFEAMLIKAIEVSSNSNVTQEEVDQSNLDLLLAIDLIDVSINKNHLKKLIDECSALDLEKYESMGQEEFLTALKEANQIYTDDGIVDKVIVSETFDKLMLAKSKLVLKQIDTSRLEYLINLANQVINESDKYKQDDNWNIFVTKLDEAKQILASCESQMFVDQITSELSEAYSNLRLQPNEAILEELRKFIDETKELDFTKYSLASQAIIKEAIVATKAILEKEDFSQYELLKVMGLVENANKIIANPDATVNNENPVSKKKLAQATGDKISIAGTLIMMAISLRYIYVSRKRSDIC